MATASTPSTCATVWSHSCGEVVTQRETPLILPLESTEATVELVGGKGASLARLRAAGLRVPNGFHLTTLAYRRFVDENHLEPVFKAALAAVDPDDPATFESASTHIRTQFELGSLPAAVAEAVRQAYAALGVDDPPVAVRSSATAEDLADLSFAGQQDTFLNVQGLQAVLDSIRRCWASLWTARAIGYRARHAVPEDGLALAVVVQRMVAAHAAGILFTADPVGGNGGEVVINAAWGLGEGAVNGSVTPDVLIVNKRTRRIVEHIVSNKTTMVVSGTNGTHTAPAPAERRRVAVLDDTQALALAETGMQVEALYGQPMDVEWAIADGHIFLTQARSITTRAAQSSGKTPPEVWNDSLKGDYIISTPEKGDALQPDEILVTTVTNVGWTPLFLRAAAVVTDVGAPLSHAAIVARELGIPAVVGCGNVTTRLHSGDRIRVNGERGVVEVLQPASSAP